MSSIEIRKYEYQADRAKNYFASPTFIDGISLDKILIDGFPIFNEEFANQFDSFDLKASDYDLIFSRLEDTLTTNGQTLETFLSTELDNHCLACKVTIGDKTFGGLIDVNSITFIDNLDSDGYKIKITIFGWEKEFSLAVQGKPFQPELQPYPLNIILQTTASGYPLFSMVGEQQLPLYIEINANMDWVSHIGYEPYLIGELWAQIINDGYANDVTTWKLFEDLCRAFGLVYKFGIQGDYVDYFWVTLDINFRDTGFSSDTISVNWLNRERGFISDINANVIQCFKFQKKADLISTGSVPIQINENTFYGTVFNKDIIATYDGDLPAGYDFEEAIYSNGEGMSLVKLNDPFPFDVTDAVNFVDMNYYFPTNYGYDAGFWRHYVIGNSAEYWYSSPQIRQAKYISFPRMFTKAGYTITPTALGTFPHRITYIAHPENIHYLWNDLIENTCGTCYNYLLQTFKKYVSGSIDLIDSLDVNVFDKIIVNEETYTIYKVSNLNLSERTCDIFAIQD